MVRLATAVSGQAGEGYSGLCFLAGCFIGAWLSAGDRRVLVRFGDRGKNETTV